MNGAGGYRVQIAHRGNLDLLYFDELSREAGIRISDTHELIKVRVNAGDRDDRREMVEAICKRCGADLIQTIGHVAIFYRRHPEHPSVRLPV